MKESKNIELKFLGVSTDNKEYQNQQIGKRMARFYQDRSGDLYVFEDKRLAKITAIASGLDASKSHSDFKNYIIHCEDDGCCSIGVN